MWPTDTIMIFQGVKGSLTNPRHQTMIVAHGNRPQIAWSESSKIPEPA